ncbi:MAG: MarC family protein [Thermoanaerobaculia bacterium]
MPLWRIALLSFAALITMVNPLAVVPSFVALTKELSRQQRATVALLAGASTTAVLLVFLLAGNYVFRFFGITVPAFQIMGGIIFFANAFRTLIEDEHRFDRKSDGAAAAVDGKDLARAEFDPASIAVVPLAIPMLSGPGAITSTMVLVNLYPHLRNKLGVIVGIVAVGVVSWLTLLAAVPISHVIGERGRLIFSKVMALLLGAIGVQFVMNGLKPLIIEILKGS